MHLIIIKNKNIRLKKHLFLDCQINSYIFFQLFPNTKAEGVYYIFNF